MDIKKDIKFAQKQLSIEKLRKHQVKPINNILAGNDTMVIAPTSAGKSAIYQIPALIFPAVTLVVEPTISLMYDQVQKMNSYGINVGYIDSSMPAYEQGQVLFGRGISQNPQNQWGDLMLPHTLHSTRPTKR